MIQHKTFEDNWRNIGDEAVRDKAAEFIGQLPVGTFSHVTESHRSAIYSAYPGAERHDSYLVVTVYWETK